MSRADDLELRKNVLDELEWDPSIDARTIGVIAGDGIVALTGHVDHYADKTNAEKIVKRVHGVLAVANDLEVTISIDCTRDDMDITRSALVALEGNGSVPKDRVQVSVVSGWVTIDGDVEWTHQKRAAEEAVGALTGVRGVSNNMLFRGKTRRAEW